MSLYTNNDICNGCKLSVFHDCCDNFCKCKEKHENEIDACTGTCEYKQELNPDRPTFLFSDRKRRTGMRNMSFMLTPQQIIDGTKTVTRRMGWKFSKVGDLYMPVEKCQGLKKGEKVKPLRGPIEVVDMRREPLNKMFTDRSYGCEECKKEGFEDHPVLRYVTEFIDYFCCTHKGCTPNTIITRIEFRYTD